MWNWLALICYHLFIAKLSLHVWKIAILGVVNVIVLEQFMPVVAFVLESTGLLIICWLAGQLSSGILNRCR